MMFVCVTFQFNFKLASNSMQCFEEELVAGTVLQAVFGVIPRQNAEQPNVEVSVTGEGLYENFLVEEHSQIYVKAPEHGIYHVCFITRDPDQSEMQETADLFYEVLYEIEPSSQTPTAYLDFIGLETTQALMDAEFANNRIEAWILPKARSIPTAMVATAIVSILAAWLLVCAQNKWISAEIKRRL